MIPTKAELEQQLAQMAEALEKGSQTLLGLWHQFQALQAAQEFKETAQDLAPLAKEQLLQLELWWLKYRLSAVEKQILHRASRL